ncbi:MAG: hypothetical protein OXI57_09880 [Rhodospirillales bacterium]|nr:hypothetical protein [Rhodospirillales bacterium]
MATQRQIEANRENARKSTGPRTEAGKAASSANALSHGLTAECLVLLPDEDGDAFARLREGVIADLAPAGALQEVLAERVAVLLWRLDRAARMEAELFIHGELSLKRSSLDQAQNRALVDGCLAQHLGEEAMKAKETLAMRRLQIDASIMAEAPSARVLVERRESARTFDRIARHEAMLQRSLNRTLDEFRRLRDAAGAAAENSAPPPDRTADPDPAPPAEADPESAPSGGARPPAPRASHAPAVGVSAGAARDGEEAILQNEANSAQCLEGASNSGSGVNPPTAPPVA